MKALAYSIAVIGTAGGHGMRPRDADRRPGFDPGICGGGGQHDGSHDAGGRAVAD